MSIAKLINKEEAQNKCVMIGVCFVLRVEKKIHMENPNVYVYLWKDQEGLMEL